MFTHVVLVFLAAIVLPTCHGDGYAKPFNCKGTVIDDNIREIVLNYHNELRQRINEDQVTDKAGTTLPKAANMYKLIYDCALEEEAVKIVSGCNDSPAKPAGKGMNFVFYDKANQATQGQLQDPLTQGIQAWIDQITKKDWPAGNKYDDDAAWLQFSNMILAKTTGVGCYQEKCGSDKASAACVFTEPDVANNDELYKSGTPCTQDNECTTYTPSTCDTATKLCVKADIPTTIATTASSQGASTPTAGAITTDKQTGSTGPAPGPTTTTPQVTTTNAHKNPSINRICPTNSGVNDKIRNKTLEMHNWRRSELALGRVSKRNGNMMPQAANMIKFKYSCELEVKARDHSRKCVVSQSDPNSRPNTEENIYIVAKSDVPDRVEAIAQGVKAWWKKVRKDKPIGPALVFRDVHLSQQIRKFTKMAWANTQEIGCAVRDCGSNYVVVCHYRPGGNIVGQRIYVAGTPCSNCPANASCNRAEGLCVLP